ncbi:hypothetical protein F0919_10345 [Taibaiella lutea]|uniref:MerR family transcriptional regulator n=1 Tax=Taibaiella lutea TaxID=2608001 RepID=A0A5M6CIF5_9BACT|nr:chaperone modulator CbpM [Taibaiella lutea]KAA5534988.1 hypothetical protein F0919_10345 [Taibaiella lutea]
MAAELISIEEYCRHHHTEITFINALKDNGLIQVIYAESSPCIDAEELEQLEKYTRLYNELELNIPGIEVVNVLLEKMETMQHRIQELEYKLHFYQE